MSNLTQTPVIKNIADKIEFGILEGQTFQQIFRFSYSYLEWIIRDTEICFKDLDEFFLYGKPIDHSSFSQVQKIELFKHVNKNNKPSKNGGTLVHFKNYLYLKNIGALSFSELKEMDYKFPEDIAKINKLKIDKIMTTTSVVRKCAQQ
jgi:hypothetical protein